MLFKRTQRRPVFRPLLGGLSMHVLKDGSRECVSAHILLQRLAKWNVVIGFLCTLASSAVCVLQGASGSNNLIIAGFLLALLWSYLLMRFSARIQDTISLNILRWINSVVMLTCATLMLIATGSALSPLFWLYLVLISAEMSLGYRRGLAVAWLSCFVFCALFVAQLRQWFPIRTGFWDIKPFDHAWMLYALGIVCFYIVIAVSLSVFFKLVARKEKDLLQKQEDLAKREHAVETERTAMQIEHEACRQKLIQLDQAKYKLDEERKHWKLEQQQQELQSAQAMQRQVDQEALLLERERELENRSAQLEADKRQFDEERTHWENHRLRSVNALDEREASLREEMRELEEAKRAFESQRVQTTESLMALERTLLANLKRIGEEIGKVEQKRREAEKLQGALAARQEQLAASQAHLDERAREIAAQAQQLQHTKDEYAKEKQRASQGLALREETLQKDRDRIKDFEQKLIQRESALEALQAGSQLSSKEKEANLIRREAALYERERELALNAAELEQAKGNLELTRRDVDARLKELDEQSLRLKEQHQFTEEEALRIAQELRQKEQLIQEQSAQLLLARDELQSRTDELKGQIAKLEAERCALLSEQSKLEKQRSSSARAFSFTQGLFVQRARNALNAQARRLREQLGQLAQQRREVSAREHKIEQQHVELGRVEHELQQGRLKFDAEKERMIQQLHKRELELSERLKEVGDARHQLGIDRKELESAKAEMEAAQQSARNAQQQQGRILAEEHRKANEELEATRNLFIKQRKEFDEESHRWQAAKQAAEEGLSAREKELDSGLRLIEQKKRELSQTEETAKEKHGHIADLLTQEERDIAAHTQQLCSKEKQLGLLQSQLEAQRREVEGKQQQMAHAFEQREKEFSSRLEQLKAVQQQVEQGHDDLDRQREHIEDSRRQLTSEEQKLEAAQRQLNEARRLLADASMVQVPEQFSADTLTMLANELNSPLTSLRAAIETLLAGDHGELPRFAAEVLGRISKSSDELSRIMVDVLDVARVEHGQLAFSICQVALVEVLARAEREIQTELQSKGLSIKHEGYDNSLMVGADAASLERIFVILLRNAVQYTMQGGINISCSIHADRIVVSVEDTGVGIDPANLKRLFARPQIGALLHGKGISLYLARCLAKSMGSDVTLVSSEIEKGSTFCVTLPKGLQSNAAQDANKTAETNR